MLREIHNDRLVSEGRRLFADDFMELYVWHDGRGRMVGFQLCYDIGRREKAFTWLSPDFRSLSSVDSGEDTPLKNMSPVLTPLPDADIPALMLEFRRRSGELDRSLARQLLRIMEGPAEEPI